MRYSYEFKMMCVELYQERHSYPEVPDGISLDRLRKMVRLWYRLVEEHGPEVLKHPSQSKAWSPEEKLELVQQVLSGKSIFSVAISAGISDGMLYQWVRKYKIYGYNGLVTQRKGPKPKDPAMSKKVIPAPLTESEREELIRLRAEVEFIKAENEVIKKEIALRHAKWDEELKAKKQRSSRNSAKKGIN